MIEDLKKAIERSEAIEKEFETCLQSNGKDGNWSEIRERAIKTHEQIKSIYEKIKELSEVWQKHEKQAKLLIEIKKIKL